MITKWDSLCGRELIDTETDIVMMYGGAMCCYECETIYEARKSWHEHMGFAY